MSTVIAQRDNDERRAPNGRRSGHGLVISQRLLISRPGARARSPRRNPTYRPPAPAGTSCFGGFAGLAAVILALSDVGAREAFCAAG